jgi:mannose-1-phosphate guanylyltransferase
MLPRQTWTIVLAAGAGRRLSMLTGGVPKQFWRPRGGRSLLEETLARLERVAPAERTVVVVDRSHRQYLRPGAGAPAGWVIYQPEDRGTAAGVLLGLTTVLESAPDATVVVSPSDHGVADDACFQRGLALAASHVDRAGGAVLLGVQPSGPTEDYGWIAPAAANSHPTVRPVASFVEKPPAELARRLFATGALWNTMVVVAKAQFVADLYAKHLPRLAAVFDAAMALPASAREEFFQAEYARLPVADFSRDLLTPARGLCVHAWPASMGWSDLGTPERLMGWLGSHGRAGARSTVAVA